MIKVSGLERDVPFDVEKWDLGEPIEDDKGAFADQMGNLAKDLNGGVARLQDLVRQARQGARRR